MAQTFYPITPVEVTPGTAGSWQDVNVSAYVPSGATGVILHIVNTSTGTTYALGIRKNGSTDDRHPNLTNAAHLWAPIGIDANRVFEAYIGSTTYIDIYLVGYTMSGVTFFTNAYDKSLGSTGAWTDINCATQAPSAIGLIFEGYATSYYSAGFRKNGSTDDRTGVNYRRLWMIIGCDTSQVCEGYISNTAYDFFLIGYITDGATFNTNATDVSLSSTGSWHDLTALPATANMGFIEVHEAGDTGYIYGLRKNGSSENILQRVANHYCGFVECDTNRIIEGYIEVTTCDFFVVGYSTAVTIVEKSSSDTGSGAEASSPIATLSKTDSGGGVEALLSRVLGVAEAGSGAEAGMLLATLIGTGETGSGAEFATKLFSSADSGSGAESLLTRLLATSEIGTGAETLLSRLLHHADSGLATDACSTLLATLFRAETGSGIDAFISLIITLASNDTGLGVGKLLGRVISLFDAGLGLDAATLYKTFLSADSGVGLEALTSLLAVITTNEIGSALEQLKAKIMTSAGAYEMKLPTKMGKTQIPTKGVNL